MIQRLQQTPFTGALLTGVLMGVAYPPGFLGALAWIGLIPLLLRLQTDLAWRSVIIESVTATAVMTVIVGYWTILHPLASARAAALSGLVALSLTSSIPFWTFGFGSRRRTLFFRSSLLLTSAILIEFAHFHTEIGFPWLAFGHTQAVLFPINQLAAYVGVPGLSVWVLTVNLIGLQMVRRSVPPGGAAVFAFAAILIVSLGLGFIRTMQDQRVVGTHTVLAVQPAMSPSEWANVYDRTRPLRLIEMSSAGIDDSLDLIVWPETTLPVLTSRDQPSEEYRLLSSFIDSTSAPLLTGAIFSERNPSTGDSVFYNSAIVLRPFVGITARYDKRIPVPFAERVPWVDRFAWLGRLAVESGGVSGYAAGRRPGYVDAGGVTVGVLICFESVFGRAARDALDQSMPDYFVVLAQDGWWGDSPGYQQHYAITRLRAIETGRAVLQATVTGTTGLMLPDGRSVGETRWMQRVARRFDVPVYDAVTPYARLGDRPVWILNLLLALSGLAHELRVRN